MSIYKETADIIAKLEELNTPFKATILQELVDWYRLDVTVNKQELFKAEMYGNTVQAEKHAIEDAKLRLEENMKLLFEEHNIEKVGDYEFIVKEKPIHQFQWEPYVDVSIKVKGVKQS